MHYQNAMCTASNPLETAKTKRSHAFYGHADTIHYIHVLKTDSNTQERELHSISCYTEFILNFSDY